jgi:hypothetical protein
MQATSCQRALYVAAASIFSISLTWLCPENASAQPDLTKPLGAIENPIRACGPDGQREYVKRLQCASGKPPAFSRSGSGGRGVYGTVIDHYELQCDSQKTEFVMDMYHCKHREAEAPRGFKFLPFDYARMAKGCPPDVSPGDGANHRFEWYEVETPAVAPAELRNPPGLRGVGEGGWTFINGVVKEDGKLERESLRVSSNEPARNLQPIIDFVKSVVFSPAIHHQGCSVRQIVDVRVVFPPELKKLGCVSEARKSYASARPARHLRQEFFVQ